MPSTQPAQRIDSVLVVSTRWEETPGLRDVARLLEGAGITTEVVATIDEALVRLLAEVRGAQALLLDAGELAERDEIRAIEAVAASVARVRTEHPAVAPLVLASKAPARLVAAVFRAKAADLIDLASSDDLSILGALDRAAADHFERLRRRQQLHDLHALVEDFLRVLVRSERRTLELEAAMHPAEPEPDRDRPPQVLVIDDEAAVVDLLLDVLTNTGMTVLPSYSGEEGVELLEKAGSRHEPVDLVLIDKNLPGIDGIETVRRLRQRNPGLPCMIMTGFSTKDSAVVAADLGVVGYVLKPFDDVRELAARVKELASRFAAERRERHFLVRIKQRHASFLERYQRIAADINRLAD